MEVLDESPLRCPLSSATPPSHEKGKAEGTREGQGNSTSYTFD